MNKLFIFLVATILFASCSSDSNNDTPTNKTYKVTFKVTDFKLETSSLKADNDNWSTNHFFQYAIYKSSGEFIKSGLMEPGSYDRDNIKIEEELLAGNYLIAVATASNLNTETHLFSNLSNFNTDYCDGNTRISRGHDNETIYYEKRAFTVGENAIEINDITLKPMWSFLYVNVTDAATCYLPEGTAYVQCTTTPFYYGFNLKDGVATKKYETSPGLGSGLPMTVGAFRGLHGLMEAIPVTATKNATVKFICLSSDGNILSEKVIYTGDIENGYFTMFKGSLGNSTSNTTFNVSLADLTDGGIIPFN